MQIRSSDLEFHLQEIQSWAQSQGPFQIEKSLCHDQQLARQSRHWSKDETIRLLTFVDEFHQKIEDLNKNQRWTYFEAMSDFVKTRNITQCRSYYNKLKSRFGSAEVILLKLGKSWKKSAHQLRGHREELRSSNERLQGLLLGKHKKRGQNPNNERNALLINDKNKNTHDFKTDTDYVPENGQANHHGGHNYSMPKFCIQIFYPWLIDSKIKPENLTNYDLFQRKQFSREISGGLDELQ